ncbi:hypothetical protein LOK49_LG09G01671 [Camellia lanceoleosa]|uniref:Uncharacterized protein n=1 Tax=Camellia lanceoleosa TaxID=1840588 RepID=A0ACC0GID1_9ERIC|nr:hypothetical protein LOK49_LG09G01671 [Camellia lanceoleosa]
MILLRSRSEGGHHNVKFVEKMRHSPKSNFKSLTTRNSHDLPCPCLLICYTNLLFFWCCCDVAAVAEMLW